MANATLVKRTASAHNAAVQEASDDLVIRRFVRATAASLPSNSMRPVCVERAS